MIVRKQEFIEQFTIYVHRRLTETLREEGYEDEMFDEAFRLLTEHRDFHFTRMRYP